MTQPPPQIGAGFGAVSTVKISQSDALAGREVNACASLRPVRGVGSPVIVPWTIMYAIQGDPSGPSAMLV